MRKPKVQMYLRPPISYYGGKQQLLSRILPLIPQHQKYIEPFVGGGAVFWSKEPSEIEIINDADGFVVNFYQTVKDKFEAVSDMIHSKPISRKAHDEAICMRQFPDLFTDIQKAWSFFYMTNTSMLSILENAMNVPSKDTKPLKTFNNKVDRFLSCYQERLRNVFIEHRNALYVITRHDNVDAFHFIDPPYFNSNMGHYDGYTQADFVALLNTLEQLEGKFLLTCYPSDLVESFIQRNQWQVDRIDMSLSAGAKGKRKIELLIKNY